MLCWAWIASLPMSTHSCASHIQCALMCPCHATCTAVPTSGEFVLYLRDVEEGDNTLDVALQLSAPCLPSEDTITGSIRIWYTYTPPPRNALLPLTSNSIHEAAFGKFFIRILKCQGLRKADVLGKSDPFVRVGCRGRYTRWLDTSVKYRTLNPYFNEWCAVPSSAGVDEGGRGSLITPIIKPIIDHPINLHHVSNVHHRGNVSAPGARRASFVTCAPPVDSCR